MNSHEFILENVEKVMISEGFQQKHAKQAADGALEYYKQTARFKRGAMEECLKHARKKCKALDKADPRQKR